MKKPKEEARVLLQRSYLPTQVPVVMLILFREGLVGSILGVPDLIRVYSWKGCYSKDSQRCYTKKEGQKLEKKRKNSQKVRGLESSTT
jgi:hypothetical protein